MDDSMAPWVKAGGLEAGGLEVSRAEGWRGLAGWRAGWRAAVWRAGWRPPGWRAGGLQFGAGGLESWRAGGCGRSGAAMRLQAGGPGLEGWGGRKLAGMGWGLEGGGTNDTWGHRTSSLWCLPQ